MNLISYSISTRFVDIQLNFVLPIYDCDTRQVYAILDEVFLAGEIEETSKDVVLSRLEELEKLE